jgi:VCBS repeat-containing protein
VTHQDALIIGALLTAGEDMEYRFDADRQGYLHLVRGQLRVDNVTLNQGDGLTIQKQELLELKGIEDAEILLFDLP